MRAITPLQRAGIAREAGRALLAAATWQSQRLCLRSRPGWVPARPVPGLWRVWMHSLAPLRSRIFLALAFDAAVLGALASFVTGLLATPAASDGRQPMLLAALLLTACWSTVVSGDVRRLLRLIRRWRV